MKRPCKGMRLCRGCKEEFPREILLTIMLCPECSSKTSTCQCGCGESMPYYTKGGRVRKYINTSHTATAVNNNPEIGRKISKARSARWKDPASREKNTKALKGAWKDNDTRRELAIASAKAQWQQPEYRESHSRENHHYWNSEKDDKYYGPDWPEIREAMRKRDSYTCQICARVHNPNNIIDSWALVVHHIIPIEVFKGDYDKANEVNSLICLCRSCHMFVHNGTVECPNPTNT